jgi:carboxyl-terminal processing protease
MTARLLALAALLATAPATPGQAPAPDPAAASTAAAAAAPLTDSERAFNILAEVMREVETRCLYKLTRDEIFRGLLRALADSVPAGHRALVPSAAGLRADQLFDALTESIHSLAETGAPELAYLPLVSRTIHRFLQNDLDVHCEFIEPALAATLAARAAPVRVGVGLSLEEPSPGELRCFPYPGESADLAGIEPGELLVAVAGRPVAGLSRYLVAPLFAGEDGTRVTVRVRDAGGAERDLELRRRLQRPPLLEVLEDAGGSTLRIRRFREETPRELQGILARTPPGRRLIFDLRGCKGGDLEAAIGSAALLLPKGSLIATIRGRDGNEVHQSSSETPYRASRIVLRQDAGTASAAELFIAALIGNPGVNAVNAGAKTYGKGTVQLLIPLEFGGRLSLTIQSITGPGELNWEGEGILPRTETLPKENPADPAAASP